MRRWPRGMAKCDKNKQDEGTCCSIFILVHLFSEMFVSTKHSDWMHIKFIGPLNCRGGEGNYIYWSCVKYITGNAWVSAIPKKACWFLFYAQQAIFFAKVATDIQ